MPLAFLAIGVIIILVAIRNTHGQLATLLKDDMTGAGGGPGFLVWLGAIFAIWALGWIPALKYPSRLMLALVALVIFIVNRGVFANIADTFEHPPQASTAPAEPALPPAIPIAVSGAGGGGGGGSGASDALSTIGSVAKAIPILGGLF